jgi:hypothetical protein
MSSGGGGGAFTGQWGSHCPFRAGLDLFLRSPVVLTRNMWGPG